MVHASTVLIFGLGFCLANDIPSLSIKTFDNVALVFSTHWLATAQ
jgi:hypothetical protein